MIGRAGIGVDNVEIPAATAKGIIVMNTPFGNSITTAEHAITLMLALAREIPQADASTQAGKWEKNRFMGVEITGKTLGVIGCGNIGSIAADRALGLRMKVVAFDPFLSPERAKDIGVEKVELDELFKRADFITLHTPLTEKTKNIIDAAALAKMKKGVRIVNCARGGLVDEQALVDALNSKHVAGAAFDVFVEEPATKNVLFGHPNVICTPHLGASTTEAQENVALQVAEQMSDYLLTGAISNAVNFPSITAEEAPKLKPFIELAEKLGSFAGQLTESGILKVQITYEGHVAEMKIKAITSAVLSGLLRPMLGDVNVVSAPVVAKERGMVVDEIVRAAQSDYESLITVTVTTERQERSVSGTVYHDGKPRLVDIKGIRVDAEFGKSMIYVTNEDKPGFIGSFAGLLGDGQDQHRDLPSRPHQAGRRRHRAGRDRRPGAGGRARQGAGAAAGEAGQGAGVLSRRVDPFSLRRGDCLLLRRGPAAAKPHGNPNRTSSSLAASHRPGVVGVCRASPSGERFRRESMRLIANSFWTTSLVVFTALAAGQVRAADVAASSAVDAVTVYPDGASVTRIISLDLPAGENSAVLKDFPLTLDPSSLRVEGEAGAKLTIGAIDAKPPRAAPPVNLPELDKRIEALKDERANLQGAIDAADRAAQIRRALCGCVSGRNRRQGRGAADRRMARGLCRGRRGSRQRRRRHPRCRAQAARTRPRNRASRTGPGAEAAEQAGSPDRARGGRRDQSDAAGDLCRAQRALDAALRRPPRHRREGPQARARTGAPRRDHPKHRRGLVECRARGLDRADRARRQRARPEFADRAISATAASDGRGVRSGFAMPSAHRPKLRRPLPAAEERGARDGEGAASNRPRPKSAASR